MHDKSKTGGTDIASHKIPVTFFKDEYAKTLVTKALTLPQLSKTILATTALTKAELPWLKLAKFGDKRTDKGCLRHDANATGIDGVELDYDGGEMSFDDGVAHAKKMDARCTLYTTPTHTIKNPRWRILAPTSATLPTDQRLLLAARINGFFGGIFNSESFTLSQSYYYGAAKDNSAPNHRVEIIDGKFVDLQNALCMYEAVGMPKDKSNPFTDTEGEPSSKRGRGFDNILAELGDDIPKKNPPVLQGFHKVLCAAAASYMATCKNTVENRDKLKKILHDAINAAPKEDTDYRRKTIERYLTDDYFDDLVDTAITKFGEGDDDKDEHDAAGHIILSDKNHVSRARKMRRIQRPNLQHYRDDFMDFNSGAYHVVADGVINAATWTFLDKAKARRMDGRGKDAVLVTMSFQPNQKSVSETIAALKAVAHLNPKLEPPCWLNGRSDLPANVLIAFPNGLLDLRDKTLHSLDVNFFTTAALSFDYVEHAPRPTNWLKFLNEIFDGDAEQIAALQEMFGYMLIPDTSLEKAFLLIGPKRSGKGTILAMLRKLLGTNSTAGPSLKSLANTFGLAPLIGKQLAIIDDLRVGAPKDQDVLIENILKITGRGFFTIDRKFKSAWEGMLLLKLLLVSNLLPKLGDDSAALASRFISFETRVSFYGREDPTLFESKLVPELAGIFHWALEGLQRLRERRRFDETIVSKDARERLANLGSLARAFIAECCILDASSYTEKRELYNKWVDYAKENNSYPGTPEKFFESLYAASEGVLRAGRPVAEVMVNGVKVKQQINAVMGIRLKDWANNFTNTDGEPGLGIRK